jgi:16S rRNA C967 or C1407 C5-methylase (RsmB/RsmF family)/NOL1/NOP2/fmu family ribosome biogenesis protein
LQLPPLLLHHLQTVQGFKEAAFVKAHQQAPITSLRINPEKYSLIQQSCAHETDVLSFIQKKEAVPVSWCSNGFYLPQRPIFITDPCIHAGAYYVQEASSMFLHYALQQISSNSSNMVVLDACAAPGGKSTLLSSFFSEGLVVSNEVIKSRANILLENITKWGNGNVVVTNNDVKQIGALENFFDVIVVDAPCSGSGLFRKDENAISEWSQANVTLCSQRQQRIIADLLPSLKQNGKLIYSTCSYSVEENEAIVDWLLENFSLQSIALNIPENWGILPTQSLNKKGWGYRFFPNAVQGEGFFMAVFEKQDGNSNCYLPENSVVRAEKQVVQMLSNSFNLPESMEIINHQHQLIGIEAAQIKNIQLLYKNLYIKKIGIDIGMIKGKDIIPHHALAMAKNFKNYHQIITVSKEQALLFLRRKELEIQSAYKGWCLLQYCGLNLGWVKVLPNRLNNYYPTEWRILKD